MNQKLHFKIHIPSKTSKSITIGQLKKIQLPSNSSYMVIENGLDPCTMTKIIKVV
jgi:hypothetical protein